MSDNWMSVAKSLSSHYCFYLPDLRNHGRSPHSDKMSYKLMAEDVFEFFDQHQLKNVSLLGHSMGGKVAMAFARDYPGLLKKLVIVDISPAENRADHLVRFLDAMLKIDVSIIESRQQAEKELMNKSGANTAIAQFLLKNLNRDDQNSFNWRLNLSALKNNISQIMSGVDFIAPSDIPSLFIKGELSNYINPDTEKLIKKYFSNAKIVEIAGANHWVHATAAKEFKNVLQSFLTNAK
jgi:pimeloyl-ACP methyl ester carboxylesterase